MKSIFLIILFLCIPFLIFFLQFICFFFAEFICFFLPTGNSLSPGLGSALHKYLFHIIPSFQKGQHSFFIIVLIRFISMADNLPSINTSAFAWTFWGLPTFVTKFSLGRTLTFIDRKICSIVFPWFHCVSLSEEIAVYSVLFCISRGFKRFLKIFFLFLLYCYSAFAFASALQFPLLCSKQ